MNIRNIDLNLLVVFDALMTEQNVSRAAEKIFLSQPAMSHSLKKLRELLNDPILVRSGNQMLPSDLALSLHGPIKKTLHEVEIYLKPQLNFDASTSVKKFVVSTTDYFECVFIPFVIEHIAKIAPNVSLEVEILEDKLPLDKMEKGTVDIAIGIETYSNVPKHMQHELWLEDDLVGLLRIGHALSNEHCLTDLQLAALEHVYYSPVYASTSVDYWFQKKNLSRQIIYQSESFLSSAYVVEHSDYILVCPRRLAQRLLKAADITMVELPGDIPKFSLNLIWHPLIDKDPASRWLREQLYIVGKLVAEKS